MKLVNWKQFLTAFNSGAAFSAAYFRSGWLGVAVMTGEART
jgi:lipoprotein signal peptidase